MATAEPPSPMSLSDVGMQKATCASSDVTMPTNDVSRAEVSTKGEEDPQGIERVENETSHKAHEDADTSAGAESNCDHDLLEVTWPNRTERNVAEKTDASKTSHKDRIMMNRLLAAIEKATAAGVAVTGASNEATEMKTEARYINASFNSSEYYQIPWKACCSWQVVEVLLKEWFREDEKILADISNGDVTVVSPEQGHIHPHTWEHVVEHKAKIRFLPHSSYAEDTHGEAKYENRVQYLVNYFQLPTNKDEEGAYLGESKYDSPVEFEITYDNEKLPALEESKNVETPRYRAPKDGENGTDKKKARLTPLDKVISTCLKIHSPFLHNVLKSIVECTDKSTDSRFTVGTGLFMHPYEDLYHHMSEILDYKSHESELRVKHSADFNQQCDEHIDLLLGYLNSQPTVPVKEFSTRLEQKTPVVTFATLWLLLKPGIDVYVREDDGSLNAYVVHEVVGGVSETDGKEESSDYGVYVWNLAFDGTQISPGLRRLEISVFDDVREVTSLPVFPVKFIDEHDNGTLKEQLINRGKKYLEYSKRPSFLQYTGKGLKKGTKTYKRARVVVEHATAPWHSDVSEFDDNHHIPKRDENTIRQFIRVPRCECKECTAAKGPQEVYAKEKFSDYHKILPNSGAEFTSHQYLIMASHMFAFMLKDRIYDLLAVDGLEEPKMAETAIDSLVMDSNNKELIKAIARIYTDSDQTERFSADFIQGKGEGQIILLHGPPGTGKTLTAESVAEYTKRPLLSITAADLGHEPDALELSLLRYFKRASDWDAIVLLDEADVYLEQRTTHDLKRNSIVSVFLRALDYFQGIFFLTTNRVGHFDEAFMSRIHVSLGYEKLGNDARAKIWDNLFKKLGDDHKRGGLEINYEYHAKSYVKSKEVQDLQWNGREIRNAFQTAVALAVFDAKHNKSSDPPEVTENHLKQVVSMSSAFRMYMTAAHSGMDDSTWAFKHGNREDKYPSTPAKQVI